MDSISTHRFRWLRNFSHYFSHDRMLIPDLCYPKVCRNAFDNYDMDKDGMLNSSELNKLAEVKTISIIAFLIILIK